MTKAEFKKLPAVSVEMVRSDMGQGFGPPAKAGWIAVRNPEGKFYICGGLAVSHIVCQHSNLEGSNYKAYRIVESLTEVK